MEGERVMEFTSFMQGMMLGGGSGGSGGGSGTVVPPHLDIFQYSAVTPKISAKIGVDYISGEVENNAVNMSLVEYQANYEGFNIEIPDLVVGSSYLINFDFQFTSANWFPSAQYRTGVNVWDTNNSIYSNWQQWTENIDRDLNKHNHQITFTATAETMYLSFNLCGCSDGSQNYFDITNFYVETGS